MQSSNQKLSKKEAAILGGKAAAEINKKLYEERIWVYSQNPNKCTNCGCDLDYEHRKHKFCSSSCAASFNNKNKEGKLKQCLRCGKDFMSFSGNGKYCKDCNPSKKNREKSELKCTKTPKRMRLNPEHNCLYCNDIISAGRTSKFCNKTCESLYNWEIKKEEIIKRGYFDSSKGQITEGETNRVQVKRFLLDRDGHKCSICGLREWMGKPIPLIADHIDGNTQNHNIDNFRLVCGNCDMQLPTYKSRNYSKGRDYRKRYNRN